MISSPYNYQNHHSTFSPKFASNSKIATTQRNQWDENRLEITEARELAKTLLKDKDFKKRLDSFFSECKLERGGSVPAPHYRGTFESIVEYMISPSNEQNVGRLLHRANQTNEQSIRKNGFDLAYAAGVQAGEGIYFYTQSDIKSNDSRMYQMGKSIIKAQYIGKKPVGVLNSEISYDL